MANLTDELEFLSRHSVHEDVFGSTFYLRLPEEYDDGTVVTYEKPLHSHRLSTEVRK